MIKVSSLNHLGTGILPKPVPVTLRRLSLAAPHCPHCCLQLQEVLWQGVQRRPELHHLCLAVRSRLRGPLPAVSRPRFVTLRNQQAGISRPSPGWWCCSTIIKATSRHVIQSRSLGSEYQEVPTGCEI